MLKVIKLASAYSPIKTDLNVFQMTSFITLVDTKISRDAEKPEEYDNSFEARSNLCNDLADRVAEAKLTLAAQFRKTSNEYKHSLKYTNNFK